MTSLVRMIRSRRGYSLIEVIVALALNLIILAIVATIYSIHSKSQIVQDKHLRMHQNARIAMKSLAKDLNMAGYRKISGFNSITGAATSATYRADLNGDGMYSPSEKICIYRDGDNHLIRRDDTGMAQMLTGNIKSLKFTYLRQTGIPATSWDQVRQIQIDAAIGVPAAKASFGSYTTFRLVERITPPNLAIIQ